MSAEEDKEVLATAKRRTQWFGLPLFMTEYILKTDKLIIDRHFINQTISEVAFMRIKDKNFKCNIIQRIFGLSTIQLISVDSTMPVLELKNIKNGKGWYRKIDELVHEARNSSVKMNEFI